MDLLLRVAVQYAHVFAGILWIGGGFYVLLVLMPSLAKAPPEARGPVMAQVARRQIFYILRVAELTIATGVLNALLVGQRFETLADAMRSRWGGFILLGAILAIGLYVLTQAVLKPALFRMLALGREAGAGDAAAAAQAGALQARLVRLGYLQMALGAAIVFTMVVARFS